MSTSQRAGTASDSPDMPHYLTPGEVASILQVDANTLARWANAGRIRVVRTLGGHRRYLASEVAELARRQDERD